MADNTDDQRPKLVVGIGASAGGLEALSSFFDHVPAESGLAFVVVTHQAPTARSMLAELLARHSLIPVQEVRADLRLEPNHVYVTPPGHHLIADKQSLKLVAPGSDGSRLPIDRFFRSLAREHGERAVGIVLSGSGSDGTQGLKEIKCAGGMAMAQSEASALQFDMPRSAIASDAVDYVLAAEELAAQLIAYATAAEARLAGSDGADREPPSEDYAPIFKILRGHTRHDFSSYKLTTVHRRIGRRMNVNHVDSVAAYARFLRENPGELDLLFKELLIGVTSFFRDPEAFSALEKVLPKLFADKNSDSTIRAWVAGCSTGEEAYSIAILVREYLDRADVHPGVQLFATDLDPGAIEVARAGIYAEGIAADVGEERLARFFTPEEGVYRIRKEIREMLVFAPQNLIDDPPFTKLDLVTCRNLLIYLDAKLQERLIPLLHYALRPGGVLFLGSSETVGAHSYLFDIVDKRWKLFRSRDATVRGFPVEISRPAAELAPRAATARRLPETSLAQLAERALFNHLVPPSVLVHERGEIVHVHGRTGKFLEPAPGSPVRANVFNMAREGLQLDLAAAIRHAGMEGEVMRRGVRVRTNGSHVTVDLRVTRLSVPEALRGLFLIAFERAEAVSEVPKGEPSVTEASNERVAELERELYHAKEVHQSVMEELETTNEEVRSTNEELQSTNEELQSANEELETSKEEMQSLNEELHTVNSELHVKVDELSRTNDDMKNLLNSTNIATVFLDANLHIKRYTEQAKKVIRLIASDIGRPIADLVSRLRSDILLEDCEAVLRTLVFKEREVRSEEGAWYLLRITPYRTADNLIDGLVLTFDDITQVKELQQETERVLGALRESATTVFAQDPSLRYEWTSGRLFDLEPHEVRGKRDEELVAGPAGGVISQLKRRVLEGGEPVRQRIQLSTPSGTRDYDVHASPQRDSDGKVVGITGVITRL